MQKMSPEMKLSNISMLPKWTSPHQSYRHQPQPNGIFQTQSQPTSRTANQVCPSKNGQWVFTLYRILHREVTHYQAALLRLQVTGVYTIYAKDAAGNESIAYITVSYVDYTISITHSITVDCSINPNLSTPFAANDIRLINNLQIKVNVSVADFNSISGGSNTFTDVSPNFTIRFGLVRLTPTERRATLI